jgi:uncharacterized protein YlxW (UPF0749 family)
VSAVADRIRAIPTWQVTLGIALLGLGFLVAAQLAAEGPRIRYTTQERSPLVETALELQRQQEVLKDRVLELRRQLAALEQQGQGSADIVRDLNDRLEEARTAAGLLPIEGTGLILRLSDSTLPVPDGADPADYLVTARDIRTVVDELWLAGAEAIAVNTERVTISTGILDIGHSILVNQAYLAPPYQVAAIGPADLLDQLGLSQGWREFVETRRGRFGLDIGYLESDGVEVPQFAGSLVLNYSRPVEGQGAAR